MTNSTDSEELRPAPRVVIIGGGPGGYEAALVARQLGADVTVIERSGLGGAAVLTDVVPSKTLIATAELLTTTESAEELGVYAEGNHDAASKLRVDLGIVNRRVMELAAAQSRDIRDRLDREGITLITGDARLRSPDEVEITTSDADGNSDTVTRAADVILLATGASPRELPTAIPDGQRILNWKQLYTLQELPQRLIVVGSGVTGAEFAGAYNGLGGDVVLVSSRDQVLPNEDPDAAAVLEGVFRRRGMEVLSRARATSVTRHGDRVVVELQDGRTVEGSHCLMAVGSVPNTDDLGLEDLGMRLSASGHIEVDRVSRTSVRGIYAAGDCTGVLPLASVAAMQGRIAMWHALGDAVAPLERRNVTANIFTAPEIATVGYTEADLDSGKIAGKVVTLPLAGNARAKMLGIRDGFVKLIARRVSGTVLGGVIVAPRASELIFSVALAVEHALTVDDVAHAFSVYPSLSGSIAETARLLHPTMEDTD
ncbi:MAG TPA: NAD(P)H-quinone dehydrogenase [Actinomycetales bacterium]|nr:NAD(P)H-quinone dehydrogenase [Actinomycetales bacterium]